MQLTRELVASRMFRAEIWLISTLFCVGVIAGMVAIWPASNRNASPDATASSASEISEKNFPDDLISNLSADSGPGSFAEGAETPAAETEESLRQVRGLMMAGGYDRAARMLRTQIEHVSLRRPGAAAKQFVWLGMAEEMSGRATPAQLAYSTSLRGNPGSEGQALALSGLARTWLADGRMDEALDLLVDLTLQADDFNDRANWLEQETVWLLAVAMRNRAIASGLGSENSLPVFFLEPPADLEMMIDLMQPATDSAEPGETPPETNPESGDKSAPGLVVVQNPVNDLELITLDVQLRSQSLSSLVQQIGAVANLSISATPEALQQLRGRSKTIVARSQNAATLLDILLCPVDLEWKQENGSLYVFPVTDGQRSSHWRKTATKLFLQFSLNNPDDSRIGYVQLNVGSLALLAGDFDNAAAAFQSALQTNPNGELLARVLMNQAMLDRQLGRLDNALAKLYRVVDITFDSDVKGEGWAQISEISLDLGRLDETVSAANRTIRNRSLELSIEKALVAQASAYLLLNNPWAANQSVFDSHELLQKGSRAGVARFLGSYSRFLGSQSEFARSREIPRLAQAVVELEGMAELPPAVSWLASRAARKLGFDELAAQAIAASLGKPATEYWQGRISWELAELHKVRGELDEAETLFSHLVNSPDAELSKQATLELAEQFLKKGDSEKAIELAGRVLAQQPGPSERRSALQLMGAAYTALEKHSTAALCFAGVIPEAFSELKPVGQYPQPQPNNTASKPDSHGELQ